MIREAEKYLGVPYVWGGYSPSDLTAQVSYLMSLTTVVMAGTMDD